MTLEEFAAEIGVSSATVSSVFNNRSRERRISEKTVELVRRQAQKLGYQPNVAARRLRVQKDMQVCELAVVTAYESPSAFSANVVSALEQVAMERYPHITPFVEIVLFHRNRIKDMPGILDGSRYNGAVISNTGFEDDRFFQENEISYPVVFLGRELPGYDCVNEDARHIGRESALELVERCHCRNPAVLTLCKGISTQTTQGRTEGFVEQCRESGVSCNVICADEVSAQAGAKAVSEHLAENRFDGLFCVSDLLAVGAYFSIKEKGLSIPSDIAVVGIGDLALCEYLVPPLTTFHRANYREQKDIYAAAMLLSKILDKDTRPVSRVFHDSLNRRDSSQR